MYAYSKHELLSQTVRSKWVVLNMPVCYKHTGIYYSEIAILSACRALLDRIQWETLCSCREGLVLT
jgi:hypothetical protein